ncbi:MAG: sensor histidine kinase [Elusimicrobiota bacterium]
MNERRTAYFCFQGLLTAVLLLLFAHHQELSGWNIKFWALAAALAASLAYIRLAPPQILFSGRPTMALFFGDALLASLTLRWANPASDLYLIYMVIIFGAALTRKLAQSLTIALLTSLLYFISAWTPARWIPMGTEFWLRFLFLWIAAVLLAILAQDSKSAQEEDGRLYEQRLVQAEHLATLGEIAGEVAHRIKGPLTTIMVNAEVLSHERARSPEELRELAEIREEALHCKDILRDLLNLGRIEEADFARIDLRKPILEAWAATQTQAKTLGLRRTRALANKPLWIRGDEALLREAFSALLQNAAQAVRPGGRVRLSAANPPKKSIWPKKARQSDFLSVVIEDDGLGIEKKNLEKIFQPFFTTKAPQGSGLGLSAALRVMQKHGGSITALSAGPNLGARFIITLPASPLDPGLVGPSGRDA